ncbi:MAG TPA: hypothetical protein DEV98_01620 [Clostridiales bacterium]|nr:hypothetical protein [Clostridiales bacterium]
MQIFYRGFPSSAPQLPVGTALNAENLTLFACFLICATTIAQESLSVNSFPDFFAKSTVFLDKRDIF